MELQMSELMLNFLTIHFFIIIFDCLIIYIVCIVYIQCLYREHHNRNPNFKLFMFDKKFATYKAYTHLTL